MIEKNGRERVLELSKGEPVGDPSSAWMWAMFLELGDRVYDQVEHLPTEVLNRAPEGSYLSPARVVLHLIGSDLRLLAAMDPGLVLPDSAKVFENTKSEDFATMETRSLPTLELLREHLPYRKAFVLERNPIAGYLDGAVQHPNFSDRRALLGHLIWHWSFHSGHIGAVTLELGYEYHWKSQALKK